MKQGVFKMTFVFTKKKNTLKSLRHFQRNGWSIYGEFSFLPKVFGEGNGNPLQYSCLGNPMERGAWQATVYQVTMSWT